MRIALCQARSSSDLDELSDVLSSVDCDVACFPEGYVNSSELVEEVKRLAAAAGKAIVTSFRGESAPRDKACVIDARGRVIYTRDKSSLDGPLVRNWTTHLYGTRIGFLLCGEIFLNWNDGRESADVIFNPIGSGMFSHEQYDEWVERAKTTARFFTATVCGCTHADKFFRDSALAISISFVIGPDGQTLHLSKDDLRTVVFDSESGQLEVR